MELAGEPGFEPGLTESESAGLPLTYSPIPDKIECLAMNSRAFGNIRCSADLSLCVVGGLLAHPRPQSSAQVVLFDDLGAVAMHLHKSRLW